MKKLLIIFLLSFFPAIIFGQTIDDKCITCDNNKISLDKGASAIGTKNMSLGVNSLAAGYFCEALGNYSFAFGNRAKSVGIEAFALGYLSEANGNASFSLGAYSKTTNNALLSISMGSNVVTDAESCLALGFGVYDNPITNNIDNSLMLGFNSNRPTFFVSPSDGIGTTGKIGIGDVTSPEAKLHIRADEPEDAVIKLETTGANQYAQLILADDDNTITATPGGSMSFHTTNAGHFKFRNGNIGIGQNAFNPLHRLHVKGNVMIDSDESSLLFAGDSKTDWGEWGIEYENGGLNFWKPASSNNFGNYFLFLADDGNVGIGTEIPEHTLDVNGDINFTGLLKQNGEIFETTKWTENADGNLFFNDGNIGIGTSTPQGQLSLQSQAGENVGMSYYIPYFNGGTTKYWTGLNLSTGAFILGGTGLQFPETGAINIKNGNVGIRTLPGTSNALEVNGSINFTDELLHNGQPVETSKWETSGDDIYYTSGNVGIGTSQTDGNQLKVAGNISATTYYGDGSQLTGIEGDDLGNHIMTQNLLTAGNWINSDSDPDQGIYIDGGGRIGIGTSNTSSSALLNVNGKVLIGDPTVNLSSGYKLYVEDGILTEQVSVKTVANWADDVFDENYNLLPLDSLSKYIDKHKHLPELPDENSVKNNGYDIADMDAKLLRKIEELVLYVIELENEIKVLKNEK